MRIIFAARKRCYAALKFDLRSGSKPSAVFNHKGKLRNPDARNAAPALILNVHPARGKPDNKRADPPVIRLQLNCRISNSCFTRRPPSHGVISKNDALIGSAARILRPGHASGGVKFHFSSSREHKMNSIKNSRLTRTVIAQQKEMPALRNFYRRRPEVMELHQPHSRNFIRFRRFHNTRHSLCFQR